MEIARVRQQVTATIERAKKRHAERRARADEAGVAFGRLLENVAIPLFRQITNVLRADGYMFSMFTPSGSVRLASDRRTEDYIELLLETDGDEPRLVLHSSRSHGRGVVEIERAIGDPGAISEEDLLAAILDALAPFVER